MIHDDKLSAPFFQRFYSARMEIQQTKTTNLNTVQEIWAEHITLSKLINITGSLA